MAVISDDHLRELIAYADARETLFMTEPANIAAIAKELLMMREMVALLSKSPMPPHGRYVTVTVNVKPYTEARQT